MLQLGTHKEKCEWGGNEMLRNGAQEGVDWCSGRPVTTSARTPSWDALSVTAVPIPFVALKSDLSRRPARFFHSRHFFKQKAATSVSSELGMNPEQLAIRAVKSNGLSGVDFAEGGEGVDGADGMDETEGEPWYRWKAGPDRGNSALESDAAGVDEVGAASLRGQSFALGPSGILCAKVESDDPGAVVQPRTRSAPMLHSAPVSPWTHVKVRGCPLAEVAET